MTCRVNMVLTGAEGVVENGGVINKRGTYTIAVAAKAQGTPFYVAAESYKASFSNAACSFSETSTHAACLALGVSENGSLLVTAARTASVVHAH